MGDKGDLTIKEFIKALEEVHEGVKANFIAKFGIDQKDINEGRGQPLFNQAQKGKGDELLDNNLKDLYIQCYGPLAFPSRKYLLLDLMCETADGDDAAIPIVKYLFSK